MKLSIANKLIFRKWREALGGNVEFIITGGAACQVRLIRLFSAAKIPIYEGYGPTENSPVISVNCKYKGGTKFGTVGPVLKGQEVKLEADGEICVKGPSVMIGYYNDEPIINSEEVESWKWMKIEDVKNDMSKNPDLYTIWFKIIFDEFYHHIEDHKISE